MTPERFKYLINICKHREAGETARHARVAGFLGVTPMTLRRWLRGERPIPRVVEVIMEIMHFWPEVTAEGVDKLVRARDEKTTT